MTLQEEFDYVTYVLKTIEVLNNNKDKLRSFSVRFGGRDETLRVQNTDYALEVHHIVGYEDAIPVFTFSYAEYINIRTQENWAMNFYKNSKNENTYSLVNSPDINTAEAEAELDQLLENERIFTEEEYFQASLLHPSLPSTYEDSCAILKFMHNRYDNFNIRDISIFAKLGFDIRFIRKIRRQFTHRFGIEFQEY